MSFIKWVKDILLFGKLYNISRTSFIKVHIKMTTNITLFLYPLLRLRQCYILPYGTSFLWQQQQKVQLNKLPQTININKISLYLE